MTVNTCNVDFTRLTPSLLETGLYMLLGLALLAALVIGGRALYNWMYSDILVTGPLDFSRDYPNSIPGLIQGTIDYLRTNHPDAVIIPSTHHDIHSLLYKVDDVIIVGPSISSLASLTHQTYIENDNVVEMVNGLVIFKGRIPHFTDATYRVADARWSWDWSEDAYFKVSHTDAGAVSVYRLRLMGHSSNTCQSTDEMFATLSYPSANPKVPLWAMLVETEGLLNLHCGLQLSSVKHVIPWDAVGRCAMRDDKDRSVHQASVVLNQEPELVHTEVYAPIVHYVSSHYPKLFRNRVKAKAPGTNRRYKNTASDVTAQTDPLDEHVDLDAVQVMPLHVPHMVDVDDRETSWAIFSKDYFGDFTHYPQHPFVKMENVRPGMNQCFPLLLPYPVVVPLSGANVAVRDAQSGRLTLINVPQDVDDGKIDWPLLKHLVSRIFPANLQPWTLAKVMEYAEETSLKPRLASFRQVADLIDPENGMFNGSECFSKVELQTKEPEKVAHRNITNDSNEAVLLMSRYTKVLSDWCSKNIKGYAFGKSSKTLGYHIHDLARRNDTFVETDYSAFDGRQNSKTFAIEMAIYKHCFGPTADILAYKMQSHSAHIADGPMSHTTNGTRHSGAADTSLCNTLVNIMVTTYSFFSRDQPLPPTEYPTVDQISDCLNRIVAGGDDGLAFGLDDEQAQRYMKVVDDFGLEIKAEIKRTNQPLNMLARIYPNARLSPGSGVDIKRMLLKLTHVGKAHHPMVGLLMKCQGYLLMDHSTPYVREFLEEMIVKIRPWVSQSEVPKSMLVKNFKYSALLGQPCVLNDADSYLNANDQMAVAALLRETRKLKEADSYFDWKPESFKPHEVGRYANPCYPENYDTTTNKSYTAELKAMVAVKKRIVDNYLKTKKNSGYIGHYPGEPDEHLGLPPVSDQSEFIVFMSDQEEEVKRFQSDKSYAVITTQKVSLLVRDFYKATELSPTIHWLVPVKRRGGVVQSDFAGRLDTNTESSLVNIGVVTQEIVDRAKKAKAAKNTIQAKKRFQSKTQPKPTTPQ